MRNAQFNSEMNARLYRAGEFLRQHRTLIILAAFVVFTTALASLGYFSEISHESTGFSVLGFLWLTVPASFATYCLPRLLLRVVPIMNGYKPDEDR